MIVLQETQSRSPQVIWEEIQRRFPSVTVAEDDTVTGDDEPDMVDPGFIDGLRKIEEGIKQSDADAALLRLELEKLNRAMSVTVTTVTCVVCGKSMQAQRSTRRTCSDRCRKQLSRRG